MLAINDKPHVQAKRTGKTKCASHGGIDPSAIIAKDANADSGQQYAGRPGSLCIEHCR